jgi:hypothetical protein
MKDNIKSSATKSNHNSAISHIPTSIKDTSHNSHTHNYSTSNNKSTNANNSNIILNQHGVPCYNNIHIYTNGVNGIKSGDINLRQYIFNKVNKNKTSKSQNKSALHGRSNSTAGH